MRFLKLIRQGSPRAYWIAVVAGSLIFVTCAASNASPASRFPFAGTCAAESVAPDAEGVAAEAVALKYIKALTTGDVATVRSVTTAATNNVTQDSQLVNMTRALGLMGVNGEPKFSKAYAVRMDVLPKDVVMIPCSTPGQAQGFDVVAAGPAKKQFHAFYKIATMSGGEATYSLWLQLNGGNWNVAGFHFDLDQIGGRDAFKWWEGAKKQRSEGHDLIANVLYSTALMLLDRGPAYQPAGLSDLRQDVRTFRPPADVSGPTPFTWELDGKTFKITNLGPIGMPGDEVVLALTQPLEWSSDDDAIRKNHQLIDAFIKVHPEWTESFDDVVARVCDPNVGPNLTHCFGTVYEKKTGYMKTSS